MKHIKGRGRAMPHYPQILNRASVRAMPLDSLYYNGKNKLLPLVCSLGYTTGEV